MGEDFKCQSALVGGLVVPSTFLSACGATIFPKRGISHIILKVFFYLSSIRIPRWIFFDKTKEVRKMWLDFFQNFLSN